jgi:hypothetical protein
MRLSIVAKRPWFQYFAARPDLGSVLASGETEGLCVGTSSTSVGIPMFVAEPPAAWHGQAGREACASLPEHFRGGCWFSACPIRYDRYLQCVSE